MSVRCSYQTEAAAQKEILQGFERDMDQLAALHLHPDIRTDRHSCLIDLIPEQKLREWGARCKRDHDHFAKKVQSQTTSISLWRLRRVGATFAPTFTPSIVTPGYSKGAITDALNSRLGLHAKSGCYHIFRV